MENGLYGKDFLKTWDMTNEDILSVANTAEKLKALREKNISSSFFDSGIAISMVNNGRNMGMDFAFASGTDMLGLTRRELLGRVAGGSLAETAAMTSYMADCIGIRDCEFFEKSSRYMRRVSNVLKENSENGVIPQRPCVINLGSDEDSPVETIALFEYLCERFGGYENLKGKKIAISWAYSPTGTRPPADPYGMLRLVSRFGMNVVLAHPEGYGLMPDTVEKVTEAAEKSGGSFAEAGTMAEAFKDADVVIPINWAPFTFFEARTDYYEINRSSAIDVLEHELCEENMKYKDWECTEEIMESTNNAVLLHPLPADVTDLSCVRGEMTAQVYNANTAGLFTAAGLRPYVVAAMILISKSEDPAEILSKMEARASERIM